MAQNAPFSSVLDDLRDSGQGGAVSAGDILDAFEHRSLGVLLTIFGLIAVVPVIGSIPGVSVVIGTLTLIAVGHSFIGGGRLWMPESVRRREIGRERFQRAIEKVRPWVQWVDHLLKPRLQALAAGRAQRRLVSLAAALLALAFYPLAVVPYGVTVPALGVLALGLGLMADDGLMILLGYLLVAATAYVLFATL